MHLYPLKKQDDNIYSESNFLIFGGSNSGYIFNSKDLTFTPNNWFNTNTTQGYYSVIRKGQKLLVLG